MLALQAVGRENENNENESAFWTDRYRVRMQHASHAGMFANSDPKPDIPAFLESSKDLIVTTGNFQPSEGCL